MPGASLYYEVRGSGPVLLMMPGGPATGSIFVEIAGQLASHFTVVTYDPRGLARSQLTAEVDDERPVRSMAQDVSRLLETVSPRRKAFVFSNSGGAVIGLDLAARHPGQIQTLVAHEPPRFGSSGERRADDQDDLHQVYRSPGVRAAMSKFMLEAGLGEPGRELLDSFEVNADFDFFLGHYVVGLARHRSDIRALQQGACRIVPAVGADSRGEAAHLGGLGLAELLGTEAEVFPGGHGGFTTHAAEFARKLREVL